MIGWIYAGWIVTLPVAGIIAGRSMGFVINAPRWGMVEVFLMEGAADMIKRR